MLDCTITRRQGYYARSPVSFGRILPSLARIEMSARLAGRHSSQEACALLTMINESVLRRHIYANLAPPLARSAPYTPSPIPLRACITCPEFRREGARRGSLLLALGLRPLSPSLNLSTSFSRSCKVQLAKIHEYFFAS